MMIITMIIRHTGCMTMRMMIMKRFIQSASAVKLSRRLLCNLSEPDRASKPLVTASSTSCRLKSAATWGRKRKRNKRHCTRWSRAATGTWSLHADGDDDDDDDDDGDGGRVSR